MPIYEQSYRRYEARGPLRRARFWPITREALRLLLERRAFLLLLFVAWGPFLVRVIQVYVVTRFPEAGRVLPVDGRLFGQFLNGQIFFTVLVSIFGGAGLVANDLRTGAILVYLSRPLTRRDYVLGKLGVLLLLNLAVTLAPAGLLYGAALGLAPAQFATWELAWIGPAVALHAFQICAVVSVAALAVSSLSRSARVAGLGFVGLMIGLEVASGVVRAIFRSPWSALLSIQASLRAVGNALFGAAERTAPLHWIYPALLLAVVAASSLLILRTRVRAVEVVR